MLFPLLFIAAAIAAVFIGPEISSERDERISQQRSEAQAVVAADREPLSLAVWSYNQREIDTILHSLVRGTSIYRAEVLEGGSVLATVTRPGGNLLQQDLQWQIPLLRPGEKDVVGYLRLSENYDIEKEGAYRHAVSLAVGEVTKIFIFALAFFALMHIGITRPLGQLASKVRNFAAPDAGLVKLDRPFHRGHDEIDALVDVVNFTIKERRRLERAEKLRQERSASTEKLAALGHLAGGVAHDFNNILAIIGGFADLLTQDFSAGSEEQRFSQKIIAATQRGRDLVQQVMTFANTSDVTLSPTDLVRIVRQNELLISAAVSKTTHLEFTYGVRSAFIAGAAVQLGQLLMNLILNASDALDGGPGTVKVRIDLAKREELLSLDDPERSRLLTERFVGTVKLDRNYVCLSIEDSGVGIAPEVLSKIFDPFFTTKRRGRGTGLGLAVVHGVIAAHDAACRIVTRPDIGTTFSIYFPLIDLTEHPANESGSDLTVGTGQQRIILVDDEEDVLEAMKIGLIRRGFAVQAFDDPLEALAAFEKMADPFDVLVADQTMPGLEGYQLVQHMKSLNPSLKTIICSGKNVDLTTLSGVDASVAKPVDMNILANTIRSIVQPK